jgi:hypothetical protein
MEECAGVKQFRRSLWLKRSLRGNSSTAPDGFCRWPAQLEASSHVPSAKVPAFFLLTGCPECGGRKGRPDFSEGICSKSLSISMTSCSLS